MKQPNPESERLHKILAECLERLDQQGESAIDEFCAKYPDDASEIRRRVQGLRDLGMIGGAQRDPGSFPERLGDFRLLRRIGGGGMGVVYLAVQESLGREVALKLVRPEQLFFPGARERFRREVETIARVQHPGIVPIYAVGEANGIPYFAMERIVGCTLADALASLQGRDPASLSGADLADAVLANSPEGSDLAEGAQSSWVFEGSYLDACFRILKQAAEALEHAHRRGILHRDLKPSNLMVTPAGRVLLLDFGLASGPGGGSKLTRTGAQLGSLPYMSPEQLQGEFETLDERADIYALGVTLYEMLSLQSPYFSANTELTRKWILTGRPPALREKNPQIPWDAETVCLSAMERDPKRRYVTAADFARDLENLLSHRSIEARRPGALLRIRRWTQRRPTVAVAAGLTAFVALAGPIAYALFERDARQRVEEQQARAEKNFDHALQAVQTMLTHVAEDKLAKLPQVQSVRRQILEDALKFYRGFLGGKSTDPAIREETAGVHAALGRVAYNMGRYEDARVSFDEEGAILRKLVHEFPAQMRYAKKQALSLARRAEVSSTQGDDAKAEAEYREAIAQLRQLREQHPDDEELSADAAEKTGSLGLTLQKQGRSEDALATYREALEALRALPASIRDSARCLRTESWLCDQIGSVSERLRDSAGAEAALREAVAIREKLSAADPTDHELKELLGDALVHLGAVLWSKQEADASEEALRQGLTILEEITRLDPEIPGYWVRRGSAALRLQSLLLIREKIDECGQVLVSLEKSAERLYERDPEHPDYAMLMGTSLTSRANWHLARGEAAQALAFTERGAGILDKAQRAHPENPGLRFHYAMAQFSLAKAHLAAQRHEQAVAALNAFPELGFSRDLELYTQATYLFAECLRQAEADAGASSREKEEREASYLRSTLGFIEKMEAKGFRQTMQLFAKPQMKVFQEKEPVKALLNRPQ